MKRKLQAIKREAKKYFMECCAPYMVHNPKTNGIHFAFTLKGAQEWAACYNPRTMGPTQIYNYFDKLVASTLQTGSGTAIICWHLRNV